MQPALIPQPLQLQEKGGRKGKRLGSFKKFPVFNTTIRMSYFVYNDGAIFHSNIRSVFNFQGLDTSPLTALGRTTSPYSHRSHYEEIFQITSYFVLYLHNWNWSANRLITTAFFVRSVTTVVNSIAP